MKRIPLVMAAAIAAGACSVGSEGGSFGEQLGFRPGAPDEFLIIARKPLEMPPSMNLPSPEPGAPSRVELDPFADAHASLFRRPAPVRLGSASTGEQVLLSGANADGDNSVIREALASDVPITGERKFGATNFFGFAIPANIGEDDSVVQPVAETALLRRQGYLTPTAPDGIDDFVATGGLYTETGTPTAQEIEDSIDPDGE